MSTLTTKHELITPPAQRHSLRGGADIFDKIYDGTIFAASLTVPTIILGISLLLAIGSALAIHTLGLHFLLSSVWDGNKSVYGASAFIFGTLYSSFWALVIAVPISIGSAIFLSELAPRRLRTPLDVFDRNARRDPECSLRHLGGACPLTP